MQRKLHVKRNDEVVVIAGADRGKRGKVLAVFPKKSQVIVEGVRMVTHYVRRNAQHPQGAIIKKEAPIHASNVMLASEYDARRARKQAAQPGTTQAK